MADVLLVAGKKIIQADDIMPLLDQTIAKMTAQKPGSSGDQNAHLRFLAHQDHEGNPIHRNLTEQSLE